MPKRTFWLTAGLAVGAGSSLWFERRVRRAVDEAAARLRPDALAMELGRSARGAAEVASARVHQAVAIGRDQMRRTEQDLWAHLAADGRRQGDGPRDDGGGSGPVSPSGLVPPSGSGPQRGPEPVGADGSGRSSPRGRTRPVSRRRVGGGLLGRRDGRRRAPGRAAPPVPAS